MFRRLMLVAVSILATGILVGSGQVSYADGDGSSDACKTGVKSPENPGNEWVYNADEGMVVEGVCIKSGENMFGGNKHSGVLANGTYENGCYTVSGVGTRTVTVKRVREGNDCQAISHVDVRVGKAPATQTNQNGTPGSTLGARQSAQAEAAAGGVSSGYGGAAGSLLVPVTGGIASLSTLAFGIRRLLKRD